MPVDRSKATDPSSAPRRLGKERIDHANWRVASVFGDNFGKRFSRDAGFLHLSHFSHALVPVDRSKAIGSSSAPRRLGKERIDLATRRVASVIGGNFGKRLSWEAGFRNFPGILARSGAGRPV